MASGTNVLNYGLSPPRHRQWLRRLLIVAALMAVSVAVLYCALRVWVWAELRAQYATDVGRALKWVDRELFTLRILPPTP